jgi:hypothetical protein
MNSFATAISGALDSLRTLAGECVVFQRGDDWVELTAIQGSTAFPTDDGNGTVVEYRSVDWLCSACDLELNGEKIEPKRGDLIKKSIGDKQHIYEVLRPDGNEKVWRFMDFGSTNVRIHTKLKEVTDR